MRELTLTNAQFEHTLGILGELDLAPLVASMGGGGTLMDVLAALPALQQVREKKILRRLEAIWRATPEELDHAEANQPAMEVLVLQAGRVPSKETLEGITAFFDGQGLSLNASPVFTPEQLMTLLNRLAPGEPGEPPAASPSGN